MADITYEQFIRNKIQDVRRVGFDIRPEELHPDNFPHQNVTIKWAVSLGRVLIAASFGLGKTRIQCEIAKIVTQRTGKTFLLICPLGVKYCEAMQREKLMPTLFDFFNAAV